MSAMLASARGYAHYFGLAVFPCAPRGKKPLTVHGHLDATTDLDTIARWWRRWPSANVAIACALSLLAVLDIDPRGGDHQAIARFLALHWAVLASTWAVETSRGGRHFYLAWPSTVVDGLQFVGALLPGVEVKVRGYVLAPPAVHPLGDVYRWVRGQSPYDLEPELGNRPAVCPADLWRRMTKAGPRPVAAAGGSVADSLLAELCQRRGLVRGALGRDRLAIICPWAAEHTIDGGIGEAVLFAPQDPGGLGGFFCAHAHCAGRRSRELLACFTPAEIDAARAALAARGVPGPSRRVVLVEVAS